MKVDLGESLEKGLIESARVITEITACLSFEGNFHFRHFCKTDFGKRGLEMPAMRLILTILQYFLFAFFVVLFAVFSFFARALFI